MAFIMDIILSWCAFISALISSMIAFRHSESAMINCLLGSNLTRHNSQSPTTQSNHLVNPIQFWHQSPHLWCDYPMWSPIKPLWTPVVTCMEWLLMGFRLVTRFTGHLQLTAINNNNSPQIYAVYDSLWHALSVLSLLCPNQSSGNAFQWQTFLFLWIPELSPCLSSRNSYITTTFSRRLLILYQLACPTNSCHNALGLTT